MKIALISDTHGKHRELDIPMVDVLIHSGDFSNFDNFEEAFYDFFDWFKSLNQVKYKIFISGNHDWFVFKNLSIIKEISKENNIYFLSDSSIKIDNIKFYGTSWVPKYGNWAWMREDKDLSLFWNDIDEDTDFLITHTPAYLEGDHLYKTIDWENVSINAGSETLKKRKKELKKLKYHSFGHIHESRGISLENGILNINASSYNHHSNTIHEPIILTI